MREKVLEFAGGRKRDLLCEVFIVEENERKILTLKADGIEAKIDHITHKGENRLVGVKGELAQKLINKDYIYISIDNDVFKKLLDLEYEIAKLNSEAEDKKKDKTPLRFKVKRGYLRLFDAHYEAKYFMPLKYSKEMSKKQKNEYQKLLKAVKQFNNAKYHLDGVLDASEFEIGQEFTLEELEQIFKSELKQYDALLKKKQLEQERQKAEIEAKRAKAIEEAKKTGKRVLIRKLFIYDGDNYAEVSQYGNEWIKENFGRGLGAITVYEAAMPDGSLIEWHSPSY